jgi:peptidoglycan/xylan/chitin deacetylase (PgdA/CDA1 family)
MSRWIKRLRLTALGMIGVSLVSIPVAVAVAFSGDLTVGAVGGQRTRHENAAAAIEKAAKCSPTQGYYALTFDDGPFPKTTGRLVGAIRQAGAVGTFFDVGERVVDHPELVNVQRTVGQVANHTFTHPHLPQLSQERRFQELTETARALDHPNPFVRPPYGETSPATDADMRKTGLVPVYWTTDTYDWQQPPVDTIVMRALAVRPEGIILLHDGLENTIAAVPRIVAELRGRGLCPGRLARTPRTIVSAYEQVPFNVVAVDPRNGSGVTR